MMWMRLFINLYKFGNAKLNFHNIRRIAVNVIGRLGPLFYIFVAIPVSCAFFYFFVFSSDVYVSESGFVVRNSESPKIGGLGQLLSGGITSSKDESAFAAQAYMTSRDALKYLNADNYVQHAYTRPGISLFDRFNPVGIDGTFEDLYRYFIDMVRVEHDSSTSITTIQVRAFTPEDARRINLALVEQAEKVVNELNERARGDMIRLSRKEVEEAQARLQRTSVALATYRNAQGLLDPEHEATATIELITKLRGELVGARSQLSGLKAIAPDNPQVQTIEDRIATLSKSINDEQGKLTGSPRSMATRGVQYQRLQLANTLAEKEFAIALNALQEARNDADKKQSYIERLYMPNLPDKATEPRRLRGMASVLLFSLLLWGLARVVVAGVREHKD